MATFPFNAPEAACVDCRKKHLDHTENRSTRARLPAGVMGVVVGAPHPNHSGSVWADFLRRALPALWSSTRGFRGRELGAARALCILLKGIWVVVNGCVGEGVWWGGSRELVPSPVGGERV